jgi:hypothetical protein
MADAAAGRESEPLLGPPSNNAIALLDAAPAARVEMLIPDANEQQQHQPVLLNTSGRNSRLLYLVAVAAVGSECSCDVLSCRSFWRTQNSRSLCNSVNYKWNLPQIIGVIITLALFYRPFDTEHIHSRPPDLHHTGLSPKTKGIPKLVDVNTAGYDAPCDRPLAMWCVVQALRLVFSVAMATWRYVAPANSRAHVWERHTRACVDLFVWIWLLTGNFWLVHTLTCMFTEPHVFNLVATLIVAQMAVLLAPCFVLFVAVPCLVFCCLPSLVRIVALLRDTTVGGIRPQGADDDAIAALPSQTFRAGMFDSPPPPQRVSSSSTSASSSLLSTTTAAVPSYQTMASPLSSLSPPTSSPSPHRAACCPICLVDYKAGEEVRVLSCHRQHHFHKNCVDMWLRLNATCPSCRSSVLDRASPRPSPPASHLARRPHSDGSDGSEFDGDDDDLSSDVEIV